MSARSTASKRIVRPPGPRPRSSVRAGGKLAIHRVHIGLQCVMEAGARKHDPQFLARNPASLERRLSNQDPIRMRLKT
eukprot:8616206-Pyramimonas_sp.AAC.1